MSKDIYVLIEHIQNQVSDISSVILTAAKQLSGIHGSKVVAILLGHQSENLIKEISADRIIYIDHPLLKEFNQDAYIHSIREIIISQKPYMVLFGNTTIGSDIAGILSLSMDIELASSCSYFTQEGNMVCQICGGKIMVEATPSSLTTLVTMVPGGYKPESSQEKTNAEIVNFAPPTFSDLRMKLINFIQPDTSDVDISSEPILVSVGRGIQTQDNIELADNLAKALGGTVCASRPVVDQGWMPTSRLVGKSGKHVKPKVYIAIGISGAPEHIEAITNSETIVAINTDPKAPIFDIANFGTETDLFDLIDILVEKVNTAKAG